MEINQYIVSNEEKKAIRKVLEPKNLFNLNFMLSSVEDNLIVGNNEDTHNNVYRDALEYAKLTSDIYSAMCKQMLNVKNNIDTLYIPYSSTLYNILLASKENFGFLVGTSQKFVAEAKEYPDYNDLIIIEAELKNIPIFKCDEAAYEEETYVIGGHYRITELGVTKTEVLKYGSEKIGGRIFVKVLIEGVTPKASMVKKVNIEKLAEQAGNMSEDLKTYWKLLNENIDLENKLKEKKFEELEKEGFLPERDLAELLEKKKEEILKKAIEKTEEEEKDEELENEIEDEIEDESLETDEDEEEKEAKTFEERQAQTLKKTREILQNAKELVEEKISLINRKYYENQMIANFGVEESLLKEMENIKCSLITEKVLDKIDFNYKELHDIIKKIMKWKEDYIKGVTYSFTETINRIEGQRNLLAKEANLSKEEKKLFDEINKTFKYILDQVDNLVIQSERIIKGEQRFAKIAADTDSSYSGLFDGFKIRNESVKLNELLKNEYKIFENSYYLRIDKKYKKLYEEFSGDKAEQKKYEKENDIKFFDEESLEKYLESLEQIGTFLNYLYNPKNAKSGSKINRFDEMVLIEENELKRQIFKYAKKIILEANVNILEDEIEILETRSAFQKIISFLSGKKKTEDYFILRMDEVIDELKAIENKELPIDRNYKIHEILAEIMIFKSENAGDDLVSLELSKLNNLEVNIAKNFTVDPQKVVETIDEKKNLTLLVPEEPTKEEEVDIEVAKFKQKYEYDKEFSDSIDYEDTTYNEIKQIVDYCKIAFNS